jgi:hypothetical protein
MPDHTHILIGLKPSMALSDLIEEVKAHSAKFVSEKQRVPGRVHWQASYGAFRYGHSQLSAAIHYIQGQEQHHARQSFQQEYLEFLKRFEVVYEPKYLFDFGEEVPAPRCLVEEKTEPAPEGRHVCNP